MLIKDVVTPNERAAFTNDVQLSWYPHSEYNLRLVRGYMFTGTALEGKVASAKVLETLRDSFLYGSDNRHVVIATYGQGKSHFALSLANFFGQPADSEAVKVLIANIEHATDASKAQSLHEFKADRPPFLIIRLRGDQPQNLHQQFVQALETALSEHPGTRNIALPFWFGKAEAFLKNLSSENLNEADAFLTQHKTDIANLLHRVSHPNRDQSAYDLCVLVFVHITGVKPDFGGEVSLEQMIQWAADTFCNETDPIAGGVLILFDEFSAFTHRYAQRTVKADTPLQDLLNGVYNRQRKVVFVAFSQRDPVADAKDIYQYGGEKYDSLLKELERLPKAQWHYLYSSLETVLHAYLKQTKTIHEIADTMSATFTPAITDTMQLLKPRYDEQMGWGYERVDEIVARGCFPLHPLTTGLFCSVELRQTTDPRSVIGFVFHELKHRLGQAAIIGGKPNWIHPTALVDWFGEMLAEREYKEYQAAQSLIGPEAPPIQQALLKAIFLFAIGRLQLGKFGATFSQAASHLSGYSVTECEQSLDSMRIHGYIRYDELRKVYTFWPPNWGGTKVEEKLRKELQGKTLEIEQIREINQKDSWATPIPVGVEWGYAAEWNAREVLLTRKFFAADRLREFAPRFRVDEKQGLIDGVRACVFRLIASTDEDVVYFQDNAEQILQAALTDYPLPIILVLPEDPLPKLCESLLGYHLLNNWSHDVRNEVTLEAFKEKLKRVENDITSDLERLRGSMHLIVPQAYRAAVQDANASRKVETALSICYKQAYARSPKVYFTQHSAAASNHKNAVYMVCEQLLSNSLSSTSPAIMTSNRIAGDLITKYLRQTSANGWGILTATDDIVAPTNGRVKPAWDFLEKNLAVGCEATPVKNVLRTLLNPPFGYDYHQVELLFCAWYGFNRRYLKLTTKSGPKSLYDYVVDINKKSARDFMLRICYIDPPLLTRIDPGAKEREIRAELEGIERDTLTFVEANQALQKLRSYNQDDTLDASLRKQVTNLIKLLEDDLKSAKDYQEQSNSILYTINMEPALDKLLLIGSKISNLPTLGRVDDNLPTRSSLKTKLDSAIEAALNQRCKTLETLQNVADYTYNQKLLADLRASLKGNLSLIARVDTAIGTLKAARIELDNQLHDQEIMSQVKAMLVIAPFAVLLANLETVKGFEAHGQAAQAMLDTKRLELTQAVTSDRAFIDGLEARLDNITSPKEAQSLQNEVQREYNRFCDTPYQQQLDNAAERCANLQQCFAEMKSLVETPIPSPSDAQERTQQFHSLQARSAGFLSSNQVALFTQALMALNAKVTSAEQTASNWLAQKQLQAEQGKDLALVLQSLANPPTFLTQEDRAKLTVLSEQVTVKLGAENAALQLREQDLPIENAIKQMKTTDGLASLRQHLVVLAECTPALPATADLIQTTRARIEKAIQTLLRQVDNLPLLVAAACDVAAVGQIDQSIQRVRSQYADTDELQTLDRISAQCKAIAACFDHRSKIEQRAFATPQEAEALLQELSELKASCAPQLSAEQMALFDTAHTIVQKRLLEQQQKAIRWLDTQVKQISTTGNWEGLLAQLSTPHAFLPESECARLEEVRAEITTRIEQRRQAQEQKAQDAVIAAAIKSIPTNGGLALLRGNLTQLSEYEPLFAETQTLHKQRVDSIRKAIASLENGVAGMAARIDAALTPKQVRVIEEELIQIQDSYSETPEHDIIIQCKQRCRDLAACLRERIQLEQAQPATMGNLESLQAQLTDLCNKNAAALSTAQKALFSNAAATLTRYGTNKTNDAVTWLRNHEQWIGSSADLAGLLKSLQSPPPFLPSSCLSDVEALCHRVQQQLDQDEVGAVVRHFMQIKEKIKRAECLVQLQSAMKEADEQ
jgi:hypothetical protein